MIDRICLQSYLLGFKIWVPCWHGQQNRAFAALMFKINRAGMPQDLVLRVAVAIRTIVVASGHPDKLLTEKKDEPLQNRCCTLVVCVFFFKDHMVPRIAML